jgi:hypothetical protein
MQIKRNFEKFVVTKRRFVIRQAPVGQTVCADCGEPMLRIEPVAVLFSVTQRRIFQIIETGATHFIETETGALMICLSSLTAILDGEAQEK